MLTASSNFSQIPSLSTQLGVPFFTCQIQFVLSTDYEMSGLPSSMLCLPVETPIENGIFLSQQLSVVHSSCGTLMHPFSLHIGIWSGLPFQGTYTPCRNHGEFLRAEDWRCCLVFAHRFWLLTVFPSPSSAVISEPREERVHAT